MAFFCVVKIHQGGGVAAPIGGQVLNEVLPYLNIEKTKQEDDEKQEVEVPNIEGKTIKEAKEILKNCNLLLEIEENKTDSQNEIQEETEENLIDEDIISNQFPKPGIKILEGKAVSVEI